MTGAPPPACRRADAPRGVCRRTQAALLAVLLTVLAALPAAVPAQEARPWFEVERLHPGLPPPPDDLDRSTPRASLSAFSEAVRDGDFDRARYMLDLSGVPDDAEAARLAYQLGSVVERKLWIDWASIPDRPDALVETGTADNPLAGQPRRSVRLGILDAGNRPVVLRMNRIKPKDGEPVWLFSSRTVSHVEALFAEHGPGWFEQRVPESWNRRIGPLELRIWEIVALPVLTVLGVLTFALLRSLFGWLAQSAPFGTARRAADAAGMPVALVATAAMLRVIVGGIVTFSGPVTAVSNPVLLALMILGIAMTCLRVIDAVLDRVTKRYVGNIDDEISRENRQLYTTIYAIRRIVVLIAFVAGAGLLLQQLHLTQALGVSLLASAGVLTVLLGIAGQSVLGNIFASMQLAIAKPIRIGDAIEYEGTWAYVEAIFYTFVRLRTWDDRRLIVPVKEFVSKTFVNYSLVDETTIRVFDIWLDHTADSHEVREVFERKLEDEEDALPGGNNRMLVMGQDHNGQMLRFYVTGKDASSSWEAHARLREAMLTWIRDEHPDWWPRERVVEAGDAARHGAAAGDAGG